MINKQRVKRIKNLIYAFIILVLFLPLILMSILSFRMIGLAQKMSDKLDQIQATASSQAGSSPSGSDYVIEPEGQSNKNGSIAPQDVEGKNPGNANGQTPDASGNNQPEANGAAPSKETPSSDGTLLGDLNQPSVNSSEASGINNDNSGKLNSDTATQNGSANGGGIIPSDPDGNPLTGR